MVNIEHGEKGKKYKMAKLTNLAAVISLGVISTALAGDTYEYYCDQCGKKYWSNRPTETYCPNVSCRGHVKRMDKPGGSSNAVSNDKWKMRMDVNRTAEEKRREFRNVMSGMADNARRQNAQRAEIANQYAQANFDLHVALTENFYSFPTSVQALIQDFRSRDIFNQPQVMQRLGSRAQATYEDIVRMVNVLQSPSAPQELENFWNRYSQISSRLIAINRMGSHDANLECEMIQYCFVANLAVKAFDPMFDAHMDAINQMGREYLGPGFNPDNLPEGARRLRESFLGRANNNQSMQTQPISSRQPNSMYGMTPSQQVGATPQFAQQQIVVTQDFLAAHLINNQPILERIAAKMTQETQMGAQMLTQDFYMQFQNRTVDDIRAEFGKNWINTFWTNLERQQDEQMKLCSLFMAFTVMSIIDPNFESNLTSRGKQALTILQ